MKNVLLNPGNEVKDFLANFDGKREILSIENKTPILYVSKDGKYQAPAVGDWISLDRHLTPVIITHIEDVTSYFIERYGLPEDVSSATVYDSIVDINEEEGPTGMPFYHLVCDEYYNGYLAMVNREDTESEPDYFPSFRITEDDDVKVFSGTYVCDGGSVVITGTTGQQEGEYVLVDETETQWLLHQQEVPQVATIPDTDDFYCESYGYEVKKVGNDLYQQENETEYKGIFKDGEYKVMMGSYYYPCSYTATTTEPVTVITSAGTTSSVTGTEFIMVKDNVKTYSLKQQISSNRHILYTGTTFDNLTYVSGSVYISKFQVALIEKMKGCGMLTSIVPGVAYNNSTKKIYYNKKGLTLYRDNDMAPLRVFKNRTVVFGSAFGEWCKKYYPYKENSEYYCDAHSLYVQPSCIESIIINNTEYKSTIDTGEWNIDLFSSALHKIGNNSQYIIAEDWKMTVRFTEEFFKTGRLLAHFSYMRE